MTIKYVKKGDSIKDLPLNTIVGTCPNCGRPLATRNGKYGMYVYCKNIDCHTNISLRNFALDDQDSIDLINLKRSERNRDIDMARRILMTCSSMVKIEAEWSVDRIYKQLLENSPHCQEK